MAKKPAPKKDAAIVNTPAAPTAPTTPTVPAATLDENAAKWLAYVIASNTGGTFPTVSPAVATALVGMIDVNAQAPDENGHFPAMATDAGRAYHASISAPAPVVAPAPAFAAPVVAAPAPAPAQAFAPPAAAAPPAVAAPAAPRMVYAAPEGGYEVTVGDPDDVPKATGVRGKRSSYPFDSLELGGRFFVEATAERKVGALHKSLSSGASTAHDRALKSGVNKSFAVRKMEDAATVAKYFPKMAGKTGVGVFRVKPE